MEDEHAAKNPELNSADAPMTRSQRIKTKVMVVASGFFLAFTIVTGLDLADAAGGRAVLIIALGLLFTVLAFVLIHVLKLAFPPEPRG
jgi:hypothetical protein